MILDQVSKGIDRLIGTFAPGVALRRAAAREMQDRMQRSGMLASSDSAFDGAREERTKRGWKTTSGSADADLDEDTLKTLRERSRDRVRNDGLAAAVINALVDNVVGCGFRPKLTLDYKRLGISKDKADDLSTIAGELWQEWGEECETTGRLSCEDLQAMVMGQVLGNGDIFLAPTMMEPGLGSSSRFHMKVETLEADRVDNPLGVPNSYTIRNGVEVDTKTGRPTHYWVCVGHPGDAQVPGATDYRDFNRIPAVSPAGRQNILHCYTPTRPGQSRGIPLLSPVLDLFRNVDDYVETELIASQVAACLAVFIEKGDPFGAALARATADSRSSTTRTEELVPGMVAYLRPGEKISTVSPGRPNVAFKDFLDRMVRWVCSACGIPYEIATRDYTGVTYAQARASVVEARRHFQRRQKWLLQKALSPLWRMVLEEAWLRGWFPAGNDFYQRWREWTRTHWIAPGWAWLDPQKELAAYEGAIRIGITSRQAIASQGNGEDVFDVMHQLADEEAEADDLGIDISPTRGGASAEQRADGGGDGKDAGNKQTSPVSEEEPVEVA